MRLVCTAFILCIVRLKIVNVFFNLAVGPKWMKFMEQVLSSLFSLYTGWFMSKTYAVGYWEVKQCVWEHFFTWLVGKLDVTLFHYCSLTVNSIKFHPTEQMALTGMYLDACAFILLKTNLKGNSGIFKPGAYTYMFLVCRYIILTKSFGIEPAELINKIHKGNSRPPKSTSKLVCLFLP